MYIYIYMCVCVCVCVCLCMCVCVNRLAVQLPENFKLKSNGDMILMSNEIKSFGRHFSKEINRR